MSTRAFAAFRLAVIIALVLGVSPARADEYEVALIQAVAAKERALDVNEPERWQEALRLFRLADALQATHETRYEIGFAAERLRQDDVAVEAYESALSLGLGGTASDHARAFVSERAPGMARLELRGPDGVLVSVRGAPRGQLPLPNPLVVFAGEVELDFAFPSGRSETQKAVAAAGTIVRVDLTETRLSPSPPATSEATAAPRAPETAPRHQDSASDRFDGLGWILAGSGVAVGVTGVALVAVSNAKLDTSRSELGQYCQVPAGPDACKHAEPGHLDDAQREVNAIATWKAVRTGSWVAVGAGIASFGAGLFLLGGGAELAFGPEPGGMRVGLAGAF